MNNTDYNKLTQRYATMREDAAQRHKAAMDSLYLTHAPLKELDDSLHTLYMQLTRARLFHDSQAVSDTEKAILDAKEAKEQYMRENSIPSSVYDIKYTCPKCKDTGLLEDSSHCECFYKYASELYFENALTPQCRKYTFEAFDEGVFENVPVSPGKSTTVRSYMCDIKARLEKYCNTLPEATKKNVLLCGNTGTGKTFLLYCMANAILEKGYSVLFARSFTMFNELFDAYISDNSTLNAMVDNLINVDVLIIDDLGMELKKRNFTLNILTSILDERMHAGKHTFISTNYSLKQLQEEYTDKVFSRMANAKNTLCIQTVGRDIRLSI
ncbi:MAG: AAA family ATPase [Clostridiales bacterium]|nr:AAA family ATPase [Clostridiales bacterium]